MPIRLPRVPPIAVVPARQILWRVCPAGMDPVWFGPDRTRAPSGRFNAPGHEFGVCYFGDSLEVAVLEAIVRNPVDRLVKRAALASRSVVQLVVASELRMLRFEGAGLPLLSIDAGQAHAEPYDECQQLALELYRNHPDVDGIQYRSRWDNSHLCWAVLDRAGHKLGPVRATSPMADVNVIGPILDRYDIGLI